MRVLKLVAPPMMFIGIRLYLETNNYLEVGSTIDYLMDYILFGGGCSVLRYCWACKSFVL